eukprot:scaffold5514_cov166-Ochromonas_danica.AAC.10
MSVLLVTSAGDPTATGQGGSSVFGLLEGPEKRFFPDEINPNRKMDKVGYVGMAHLGRRENTNQSQFFITLRGEDMEHFGKEYTIFGEIAEGLEVLEVLNNLYCDEEGRPFQDVRILHTYILDDPFPNPKALIEHPSSPTREYPPEEKVKRRIPYDTSHGEVTAADGRTAEEIEQSIRQKEAKSRAIVLEMLGDLPDAEVKPPDEVLFVCKLNPITRDEDLELIFSRFGKIKSCEIIRDHKTGDSLNYAFIEFETEAACIEAYEKMNNAIIDERRIKVDFSQSVSKLWNRFLLKPRKPTSGNPNNGGKDRLKDDPSLAIYGKGRAADRGLNESKENDFTRSRHQTDTFRERHQRTNEDHKKRRDSRDRPRESDSDRYSRSRNDSRDRDRKGTEKDRYHGKEQDRSYRNDRDHDRDRDRESSRTQEGRDRRRDGDRESGKRRSRSRSPRKEQSKRHRSRS